MELIFFTSPYGSCGASFCVANIAKKLSDSGCSCLVADLRFRESVLDFCFGCSDDYIFNLSDVHMKRCSFDDAVVKNTNETGVDFVSSSHLESGGKETLKDITALLKKSGSSYDYILADVTFSDIGDFIDKGDRLVYVTDPQKATVEVLGRKIDTVEGDINSFLIINKVVPELIESGNAFNIDDICDKTGLKPLGILPWEAEIPAYTNAGTLSVTDKSLLSSKAFGNIAERIKGNRVPPADFDYKTLYYKKTNKITYRR